MQLKKHEGIFLRVRRNGAATLRGYMFVDAAHARRWLSQKFVNDMDYGVSISLYREKSCCQAVVRQGLVRHLTVSEFLATYPAPTGEAQEG